MLILAADALSATGTIVTIAVAALGVIFTIGGFVLGIKTSLTKVEARLEVVEKIKEDHSEVLKELTGAIHGINTNFALLTQAVNTHLLPVINTLLSANPATPIPPIHKFEDHNHKHGT